VISGYDGIYSKNAAVTVVNAGTITGSDYAVKFAVGYANRLILDSGAVFTRNVYGGGGVLETLRQPCRLQQRYNQRLHRA
jgi:hypothetical protein